MKLTGKKWKCVKGNPFYVVETVFEQQEIVEAIGVADQKIDHINIHNPGGIVRSQDVIHSRIVAGKLADGAVYELLKRQIENSKLDATIIEYDQIRTDGFKHVDPYDLALLKPGDVKELIEVRSSFSYRLAPVSNIINKLSIYGWYTSHNKPVESIKDWYWQFIYYMRPIDIDDRTIDGMPIFEEQLRKNSVTGYVVGGANRQHLEQHGRTRKDQDGAFYQSLSPICRGGLDYFNMINLMFGTDLRRTTESASS